LALRVGCIGLLWNGCRTGLELLLLHGDGGSGSDWWLDCFRKVSAARCTINNRLRTGTDKHENHSATWSFKGRWKHIGLLKKRGALPAIDPYLRVKRFQGPSAVKKKRQLFPWLRTDESKLLCVAALDYPCFGTGILTCFPFDRRSNKKIAQL